jgi:DNA helicase-2/ATP-dependent DNA helicase PcrA
LIQEVKNAPETTLYARDLFNRLLKVLTINKKDPSLTLEASATRFQKQFRHTGRPVSYPKLIGTTLLVKGQEYEHAIVLDASSLSKKDLYVALTRGSKSLTIISRSYILRPN